MKGAGNAHSDRHRNSPPAAGPKNPSCDGIAPLIRANPAPYEQHRPVVVVDVRVLSDHPKDRVRNRVDVITGGGSGADQIDKARQIEQFSLLIARLRKSIRIEAQDIAGIELQLLFWDLRYCRINPQPGTRDLEYLTALLRRPINDRGLMRSGQREATVPSIG